jgi:hypothetical protein
VPSKTNFTADKEYIHYQLDRYFAEKGADLLPRFDLSDEQFKIGYTGSQFDPTTKLPAPDSPDEAYRKKVIATVTEEVNNLKTQRTNFEEHFERRANDTLNAMLDKSQEQLEKDRERYGAKETGWIFKDYSLNKSADTVGLGDYAKRLQAKQQKFMEVAGAHTPARGELPAAGVPDGPPDPALLKRQADIEAQQAAVAPIEAEYNELRKEAEQKHPLLLSYQLDLQGRDTPRHLAALANDTGEARAAHVITTINDKLENIAKTRKMSSEEKTRIWKLERVVGPTHNLPDVQTRVPWSPALRKEVVEDKVLATELSQEFQDVAIGAVTFAIGLIAAIPTAGASMGVVAAAGTATATGLAIDAVLLKQAVKEYQFESAASGTNYNKAEAISQDDPSLFGLAFQFLMTAIGAAMALSEARSMITRVSRLRSEALGVKAAKMAAEAELAKRLEAQYRQALAEMERAANEVKPGAGKALVAEVEAEANPAARTRRTVGGPDAAPDTVKNSLPPVPNALMHGPDGKSMTRAEAYSQYHQQIELNPNREYAIVRRGQSDEFAVIIGESQEVKIPQEFPLGWNYETHYHPNFEWLDPKMKMIRESNFHARIPSTDDMQGAMVASTQNKTSWMERLDWRDPDRNKTTMYRTTFGHNPGADKPFWTQYPIGTNAMSPRMEFASLKDYDAWFNSLGNAHPLPAVRTPPRR